MNPMFQSLSPLDTLAPASAGAPHAGWLARAIARVWLALEESGRARAHIRLADFAARCEALQPELAKELRAASRHNPLG